MAAMSVVVYLACLYAVQDNLIFYPDKFYAAPSEVGMSEFAEQPLVTADGHMIMSWYAQGDADKPVILFFHGNAGQLATFAPHLKAYIKAGYSLFMPEYRGFASSGGKLSEETMYADAVLACQHLKNKLRHDKIVVFGYSMGTAPASAAATMCSADALILAAPFYSLERVVGDKPVPWARLVLKNRLPSNHFVAKYQGPLLVVHGRADKLILPYHGQQLFELSPAADKEFRLLDGVDHNRLFFNDIHHQVMLDWLNRHFAAQGKKAQQKTAVSL